MARVEQIWNCGIRKLPWPKSAARAASCALLFGLMLAVISVGSAAYIEEELPPGWPQKATLCMLAPACMVGIGRLGWKGVLVFWMSSLAVLIPAVIGFILIWLSPQQADAGFLWLETALSLCYPLAAWTILLALKGWKNYFANPEGKLRFET